MHQCTAAGLVPHQIWQQKPPTWTRAPPWSSDNPSRATTLWAKGADIQLLIATLADPKLRARLADLGGTVLPGSPADFGKLVADEIEKWAKVVKFAGI
jgi:hypothetical protein